MPSFPSRVVGMRYYKNAENILRALPCGEPLELVREPLNPYHKNAVAVFDIPSKLGHLPWADADVIGPLMDAGVTMICRIKPRPPFVLIRWDKKEALMAQGMLRALKRPVPIDEEVPF